MTRTMTSKEIIKAVDLASRAYAYATFDNLTDAEIGRRLDIDYSIVWKIREAFKNEIKSRMKQVLENL